MLVNCDPRSDLIEFVAHLNQYYFIIPVHNVCGLPIDTISICCGHLLVLTNHHQASKAQQNMDTSRQTVNLIYTHSCSNAEMEPLIDPVHFRGSTAGPQSLCHPLYYIHSEI